MQFVSYRNEQIDKNQNIFSVQKTVLFTYENWAIVILFHFTLLYIILSLVPTLPSLFNLLTNSLFLYEKR